MRRTFLCLIASIIMYGLYVYTLPAADEGIAAQAAAEPRVSVQIAMPSVRLYAVALGVYESETQARPFAALYAGRGAAGCIVETDEGWALLGAGYSSDGDAGSVCAQLRSEEGIDARVMLFSADEVRVSMTATQSQASAVQSALEFISSLPDELSALSQQIDRGDCDAATARALLAMRCTEARGVLDGLSLALGDTADIFCRMIESLMEDTCAQLGEMCADGGPAGLGLSSLMKQCALETRLGLINMMKSLQ